MCVGAAISALCCAGSACCNCCCRGLGSLGIPAKNYPKVAYLVTDVLFMVIAVLLMYTFRPLFRDNDWLECNEASGGGYECFGTAAVLRASFVLFLYHLSILVLLIPRGQCASIVHDSFFTIKFILLLGAYIGTFWMSNDFFVGWADFCRAGSILYLIVQAYFLLNFCYLWNDQLVAVAQQGSCYANFLLCGFSIVLAIVDAVWFAFQFIWFSGCGLGTTVLVINVLFFLFFYGISLQRFCGCEKFRPNATVLVVGLANTYVVYLSWSGLASHPEPECNDLIDSGFNTFFQILVGTIFTFITLWSIAVASTDTSNKEKNTMGQGVIEEEAAESKPTSPENEEAALFPVTFQTMFFQGIMFLTSTYFGMLFTNWGFAIIDGEVDKFTENATFSMWAKIVS